MKKAYIKPDVTEVDFSVLEAIATGDEVLEEEFGSSYDSEWD